MSCLLRYTSWYNIFELYFLSRKVFALTLQKDSIPSVIYYYPFRIALEVDMKYLPMFKSKAFFFSVQIFFFLFIFISWRLITLQYCSGFCHTLTWISHGFTCIPHPNPPSTSLSTPPLWVFPVHQPQALVSCVQPGLVICFTLDNIHVSMLFSQNIPPSPSPTESKSLFCTSVSLFCI